MPEESAVETPVESNNEQPEPVLVNLLFEKIANGYIARINGKPVITCFYTKAELMKFIDENTLEV